MTSSRRAGSLVATGSAGIRTTPAAAVPRTAPWSLDELLLAPSDAAAEAAARAKSDADRARAAADERARCIDEGYARGLADGERKAAAAGRAQTDAAVTLLQQAAVQFRELSTLAPAVLEENVAALAVIVARQIIGREVSLDRDLVADLVRRALTEFSIDQPVRIRVNPLDLANLTVATGDVTAPITGARDASWHADPLVSRGGCVVEGRERIVDGRVDAGLERAYRRMADVDAS